MAYPLAVGAKLVFADVDPRTINMDPKDVARKITPKTKMIVPVHIGGYPVDLDPIMELAKKHNILVLEDAAHAFGAMYKGKRIGTIGDFAAFSFHEVKNFLRRRRHCNNKYSGIRRRNEACEIFGT